MRVDETDQPRRPVPEARATVILLVEDNPGDALRTQRTFAPVEGGPYEVIHVRLISEAVAKLQSVEVDVILLDLGLSDGDGLESVEAVKERAGSIPIVVLTGMDDEQLAIDCIKAGAQDYVEKNATKPHELRRAIGYAITRARETHVRELYESLQRYRALSSGSRGTNVTAALVGSGAIAIRSPGTYESIVTAYETMIDKYLVCIGERSDTPRALMERVITMIGDANGGPRDLLDVHLDALDRALRRLSHRGSRALAYEARLVALEMMGLLVDYYRVGFRRLFSDAFTL